MRVNTLQALVDRPASKRSLTQLSRAIASFAMLGIFACSEATTPESTNVSPAAPEAVTPVPPTSPLGQIGATLPDATDWVLVAIDDEAAREKMRTTLKGLSEHIVTGHLESAKQNVAALRDMLTEFDSIKTAELGPIAVALDQIDYELGRMEE